MKARVWLIALCALTAAGCSDRRDRPRVYRSERPIYREHRPTRVIRQEPVRERRIYVQERPAHRELPRERQLNRDRDRRHDRNDRDWRDDRDDRDRRERRIDRYGRD